MKRIAIFTEKKVGEGHYQAAKAIEQVIKQHFNDQYEINIYSGMHCVHWHVESLAVGAYFFLIRYFPRLWKWIYFNNKKSTFFQKYVFAYQLTRILAAKNPDYVICTHASCVPALNEIKRTGKFQFKLIVISTDYHIHPYLIQDHVDMYFVAHQEIKNRLSKDHQIDPGIIYDYGIPLRPEFERIKETLGQNIVLMKDKRKFHILILGGATGYGPIEKIIHLFHPLMVLHPLRISVVTGRNQKLYKKLKHLNYPHVHVFEYVQDIRFLIAQADLMITKPGGLTVTEAIACGTPLLLIQPIPGHEEANYKFLEEHELALCVTELKQIPQIVKSMFSCQDQWETWKQWVKEQHKKDSALRIIEKIFALSSY